MATPSEQSSLILIGSDTFIKYLFDRYAEQIGYSAIALQPPGAAEGLCESLPAAVIFCSVESLEASQPLIAGLTNCDIPILVCASVTDEARTRELGADHCLFHPLTYDNFIRALAATHAIQAHPPGGSSEARSPG